MDLKVIIRRHSNLLLCGVIVYLLSGTLLVTAIEVYAPEDALFENGTTGILKCSFKSKEVVSSGASVTWSFTPEGASDKTTSFFYYTGGNSYPGSLAQFQKRVVWAGDLNRNDASIQVSQMQFSDNGTYQCDVKNPPDIVGSASGIKVRVGMKELDSCSESLLEKFKEDILEEIRKELQKIKDEITEAVIQELQKNVATQAAE
ncbi:myelin protein zero-like protein 1 [Clupea harengus]|uniref:Myelin protein zero-like protein 1 n=1 Tax=Clupea harengus TaxID=7950 RepID=A0A6P8FYW6_CLUHA|nr:myelin protein zero-like protein 1 [Clupea harengus]